MTAMRQFLDAMGLPTDGWADELPPNPGAKNEAKVIRLRMRLQKIRDAMIRRKQRIESLRNNARVSTTSESWMGLRMQRNEARYRALLRLYAATQEELKKRQE
jgi:hypothetical protein